MKRFAANLRDIIDDRDEPHKRLAYRVDVGRSTLGDWLTGRRLPSADRVYELMQVLRVTEEESATTHQLWQDARRLQRSIRLSS
ncbi:helix-turn-helix domain-containing protein [Catenulispora yoronensis]